MGKRKSRSRDASPESKRSSKLTERVKQDEQSTPEVVVSPRTPGTKRVSAFSRYAKEKPTPDKEDSTQAETPKRNRSQSASPQNKRKKKRKGKRQQQVEEADDAESSDNGENTPQKPTEEREADQIQVSNADTSDDVDPNNASRGDPDGKRVVTQKDSEHGVEGAPSKVVTEVVSVSGDSGADEGRQNSSYHHRSDADHRRDHQRRHSQGDSDHRSPRFSRFESSQDRRHGGHWDSPQHQRQRSDNQDHRRRHHSPEKKPPSIKTFSVGDSVIVVAKHPETLSLWGCASVRSLHNNVDVCGFILRQGAGAIDIFSASSTSFVTIATTLPSNTPHSDIKKTLDEINGLEKSMKKDILKVVDSESTVLVFAETVGKQRLDFVTNVSPFQQIFWSKENEEASRSFLQLGSLPVAVALDAGVKHIRISHEMKKASEQFCSSIQKGEMPTVAVCGGKNVGKSTMGRYLTNCALNKCPQVAYLECDVGQTEYSPPGCVSLHLITDPVCGPPFTHQRPAHKMLYVGMVTPSDDPQYYLSCVKAAYAAYTSLTQPCPLVVNTMGWNEGLGLILLASTVSITHPKYVVQFESNHRNRNLPSVTPQFVTEQERWPTIREDSDERTPTHDLFTIKSLVDSGEFRDRYHPADHRTLSLLGYLCRFQDPSGPCLPLHALRPQTVPWGGVAVHVSHAAVPNSQVMYALNASIVGLCRVPEEMLLSSDDDSLPKFLAEKPVCECIGFGIVRSVDPENRVFQIITDLTLDSNTGINCLLRGCLDVPQSLIASQPCVGDDIPYYGESKDVHGATAIKKRRHMVRKGRAGEQHQL